MKIWIAERQDPHEGCMQVWGSSERNVRRLAMNEWSEKPAYVGKIEIPPGKAGLIEWLNKNFTRNNG